jgi:capsular polysaccharide biosynthesis protein/Mrp family chromosome partitioning ATPase
MNFSKILNIVRRFWWLFVLVTLVASLTTYFAIGSKPTIYEAKTQILVGPSLDSPSPDLNSLKIGGQLIQTYAELVLSRPFLESVNDKLEQKTNLELLAGMIETRQNPDTRILTIFVRHSDPKQAVAVANAVATTLMEMSPASDNTTTLLRAQMSNQSGQLEQIITNAEASIEELEAKLIALGNVTLPSPEAAQANLEQQNLVMSQLSEERARLSDALRTLTSIYSVLRDTNTNQLEIIEPARAVYPVDQNLLLRVAAAGIAGLILTVSIIFSSEYYDDSIRFAGDFTRIPKVPQLNIIEKHDRLDGTGLDGVVALTQPASRAANSYRAAVTKLLFSIGESLPQTLLLSSVGSQSGEDTADVVANLGVVLAQAGKRVILVDAQFHNPYLTKTFEADGKAGLAEYIDANSPKLKLITVNEVKNVQILPAGSPTENSAGAVFNSKKIDSLVEELQGKADVVLIAGSPIAHFAESLNLATHMNGVILIARPGEARIKVVNEVIDNLASMNVNLAAVIFDNIQKSVGINPKPRNVFEGTPVVSEDSHV